MEAPPQFPGAPKKSKTGLIIGGVALAVIVCCCGICGTVSYFGRNVVGKAFGFVECSIAMGQQRDALLGYANAHGGKLPGVGTWQDDIKPYVKENAEMKDSSGLVAIPKATDDFCDRNGDTSITYNADLAGKKADAVQDSYATIVLFETPGKGRNKAAPYKEQPFETSPVLLKGQRRGWIRQPLNGQATYKDQSGRVIAAPSSGGVGASTEDAKPSATPGAAPAKKAQDGGK